MPRPSDDYEERAAICHFCGGLPLPWAEAIARIDTAECPKAYTDEQWRRTVDDAAALVGRWWREMDANGWTPADIRDLLPKISGLPVVKIERGGVVLRLPAGGDTKMFARPVWGKAMLWSDDRGRP